jgi:hypothetical protein
MTEMGGRIEVQSDGLGAGSIFALHFQLLPRGRWHESPARQ